VITVDATAVTAQLVARVVTSLSASSREQVFDSEDDVGYMYVFASYANGDAHDIEPGDLTVKVGASDTVA